MPSPKLCVKVIFYLFMVKCHFSKHINEFDKMVLLSFINFINITLIRIM
jgi:hypothetical protein